MPLYRVKEEDEEEYMIKEDESRVKKNACRIVDATL